MKILLIGAGGTVGRAIAAELGQRHEIIAAGRNSGDVRIDIADPASLTAALSKIGKIDALACAAGSVNFRPLEAIAPAPIAESVFGLGLLDKLLGQVNLVLAARDTLTDGGSITLVSGILSDTPIVAGASASLVNGAVDAFVRAAAIELPRGLRINAVSPTLLTESLPKYGAFFRGFETVSAASVARAYSRSIEGRQTGQVYRVG